MEKKQRIIIIGLDGATWTSLRPLAERGELPAFKKLMEKGAYGTLLSTIPCRSGVAITTFFTGKNPCKWGLFDFPCFDADVMSYQKIKEKAESVWDILGKLGYKSAILNLSTTHPPTPTNGVMVSGFSVSEEDEYTYPSNFKENVKGFHSERETFLKLIAGTVRTSRTIEKSKELLDFYTKNAKKRYGLIKNIIEDEAFDFSIFWVDESDAVNHEVWGNEKLLLSFFREIDNILKDIVERNPDSNIIVISDHGFDVSPTHEFFPKSWLKKENYLRLRGNKIQQWLLQTMNTLMIRTPYRYRHIERLFSVYNRIKSRVGKITKKENKENVSQSQNWRLKRGGGGIESKVMGIDWSKTVAINQDFWGIRIIRENLDKDYENMREEIMEKMRQLRDKNGEKIIKSVWKREEIFNGPDIKRFPDIIYLSASKFGSTGFLPFCITKKKIKPPNFPGDHLTAREGIFIAAGPSINRVGDVGEINMTDIAPTVLQAFKVPVPPDMDGRALKEIII